MSHNNENNINNNSDLLKPFTGTIESFLEHCSQVDIENIIEYGGYADIENIKSYEDLIKYLMQVENVSREIAVSAVDEYREEIQQEVDEAMLKFLELGLVEVKSYNEQLEPMYGLTELGEQCCAEIRNGGNVDDL
jgi:hypothetical protein